MAWGWKWIADITGPAGDAAALGRFDVLEASLNSMRPNLLVTAEDATYAIPFGDKDGYVAGGVTKDGSFNFEKVPTVQGVKGTAFQPVDAPGYAWIFPDKDGYFSLAIRDDATVEIHKGAAGGGGGGTSALQIANDAIGYTRSDRTKVACIGDSLTNGYFGGTSGHTAEAYPAQLQALMPPGVTVYNVSASGNTTDQVAIRIGAISLPLTVAGGSIPASGPVTVTTTTTLYEPFNAPGTLQGVAGNLAGDSGGVLTFTRTADGAATTVPAGTVYVPNMAGHDSETAVILLGRNDVGLGITGGDASIGEHIANSVTRIVDWLSRDIKQVLILSVTTSTAETAGTAGHTAVTTANNILQDRYPTRYRDLRRYLIDQAIYDLGITPNSTDLAKMAGDTLPPSIMDEGASGLGDGVHWSEATAVLVAAQVNNYLTTRDWIAS